ncbi:DUF2218 domain-containing protein [Massilia sp. BSC265]|uniref:DUF2218 domain-containing protein n=1 Tax=Massilia sp. BSC265 TaxID=1549812 RepID=UPI0004E92A3A|nr:DUF2218 domain-containing protein [Massilia sp. BSC265]KFI08892.1 hypothetical protein JN27_01725 [Massilia sp. BSC265]
MLQSHTMIATPTASRYITRLCKHWGHRFHVDFDEQQGFIDFGDAQCRLAATATTLGITLISDNEASAELETVVEEHLLRFVPAGEHLAFAWQRTPAEAGGDAP